MANPNIYKYYRYRGGGGQRKVKCKGGRGYIEKFYAQLSVCYDIRSGIYGVHIDIHKSNLDHG